MLQILKLLFLLMTPIYIYVTAILIRYVPELNAETVKINDWMSCNKLTVNYKKSCFMLVSKRPLQNCNFDIFINHNQIEKTEYVKYLGVYLDDKLTWKH